MDLGEVDEASAGGQAFEQNVLSDRRSRDQISVLLHSADARSDRIAWRSKSDRPPVDLYPPAIRLAEPGDDLNERRLPGAVFSEQRMNFAFTQAKRDISERQHARKRLPDAFERKPHGIKGPLPRQRASG